MKQNSMIEITYPNKGYDEVQKQWFELKVLIP